VLTGIRAVKLYAWEVPMKQVIDEIREHEVKLIRKAALLRTCSDVSIITFALYIFSDPIHNILTPEVAFVSLTLFSQLRIPMMVLAELIGQLVQTAVSNRRLKHFLVAGEIDPEAVERDLDPQYERAIDVEFASFDWKTKTKKLVKTHSHLPPGHQHLIRGSTTNICIPYSLNNLELHLRRGLLVAVVGRVGAGKTSLLHALLGEMNKVYGFVGLRGRVAYVPQQVNLARALYHQADIYLLDDVLSAVDAIVGRHLFDLAIGPESLTKGSTRVLVTHSLAYLAETDWIVVMEEETENNESDSDDSSTWKGEETPSSPLPRYTDDVTDDNLAMSLMSVHSAGSFTNTLRRRTQSSRSSLKCRNKHRKTVKLQL
uniref:ABC transmembrane type-1 domain-containing protein n=1 Tax=Meloidogyne floridensis TaxID=298350 RepID=A0A915NX43_9BILA